MVSIPSSNVNNIINNTVYNAISGAKAPANTGAEVVTAEMIFNLFFKDVKTKSEFKKKIRGIMKKLNENLSEEDVDNILDSLDMIDQPPFCASYSEEGVSEQLNLKDALLRADVYDVFLMFYKDLYDEAGRKIK